MGLEKLSAILSGLSNIAINVSGIGVWLFIAGFIILAVIMFSLALIILVRAIKTLPNLTVSQFLRLMIATAIVLMIAGIIIP